MRFHRFSFSRRSEKKLPHSYRYAVGGLPRGVAENPFFQKTGGLSRKKKLLLGAGIASISASVGLVLFHPFFIVRPDTIVVEGIRRIDERQFRETVAGIITHRALGVFPRNTYALLSVDELLAILPERFPVEELHIEKMFPNSLKIRLIETESTIIYDTGSQYGYVGSEGTIVEILRPPVDELWGSMAAEPSTTTASTTVVLAPPIKTIQRIWGDYPILVDARADATAALNSPVLTEDMVKSILGWHKRITRQTDIPFSYISLENDLGDATLKTGEGWSIRLRLTEKETDRQYDKLSAVLRDIPDRSALRYIDVRFRDKAFWQ